MPREFVCVVSVVPEEAEKPKILKALREAGFLQEYCMIGTDPDNIIETFEQRDFPLFPLDGLFFINGAPPSAELQSTIEQLREAAVENDLDFYHIDKLPGKQGYAQLTQAMLGMIRQPAPVELAALN